jgi:hypothetical protein
MERVGIEPATLGLKVTSSMLKRRWAVRGLHNTPAPLPTDLAAVQVTVGDRDDDHAFAAVLSNGADDVVDTIACTSKRAEQLLRRAGASCTRGHFPGCG